MDTALELIASIPRSANPYQFLADYLRTALVPATGKAFSAALICCSVLQALALLLAVFILWSKVRNGDAWVFKRKETTQGTLWLPNSGYLFTIFSIFYLLVAQVDVWSAHQSARHKDAATMLANYIFGFKILALFAALWSETHGYAASSFLFIYERKSKGQRVAGARLFNAFFAFGYIYGFVPPLVISIVAPYQFENAFDAASPLLEGLDAAAIRWTVGDGIQIQPQWIDLFESFYSHLMEHLRLMQICYQVYLGNFLFVTLAYFIAAFFYTKCLKKQINKDFKQLSHAYKQDVELRTGHVSELRTIYKLLLAKAVCTGTMATALLGLIVAPVSDFEALYENLTLYCIEYAGQFVPFATMGTACLALMAYRAWKDQMGNASSRKSARQDPLRQALGLPYSVLDEVIVQTETLVTVDVAKDDMELDMKSSYKLQRVQSDNKSFDSLDRVEV